MAGWALGTFLFSAGVFAVILFYSGSSINENFNGLTIRFLFGIVIGLTAIGIIYSPWGKQSGAHMNPAVTLAFLGRDQTVGLNIQRHRPLHRGVDRLVAGRVIYEQFPIRPQRQLHRDRSWRTGGRVRFSCREPIGTRLIRPPVLWTRRRNCWCSWSPPAGQGYSLKALKWGISTARHCRLRRSRNCTQSTTPSLSSGLALPEHRQID
ncbi:MAG TPA: hypothetical protein EYN72_11220 [Dehalococcoidia bacterium]|nr:hypothetical protein [Dehalococcoidia bacterium]